MQQANAPRRRPWSRRRVTWLLCGAGSGATSTVLIQALALMPAWAGVAGRLQVLVPGIVFGLVVGMLAHASARREGWRIGTFVLASTLAHHLAVRLAQDAKVPGEVTGAGFVAGAMGAFLCGTVAAGLFPARGWMPRLAAITLAGACLGALLLGPAIKSDGWGLLILYVPWQAGVAFAASFQVVPRIRGA